MHWSANLGGVGIHLDGPDALRVVGDVESAHVGQVGGGSPLEVAHQQAGTHHQPRDYGVPQKQAPSETHAHSYSFTYKYLRRWQQEAGKGSKKQAKRCMRRKMRINKLRLTEFVWQGCRGVDCRW